MKLWLRTGPFVRERVELGCECERGPARWVLAALLVRREMKSPAVGDPALIGWIGILGAGWHYQQRRTLSAIIPTKSSRFRCSVSCGGGRRTRLRYCSHTRQFCRGIDLETEFETASLSYFCATLHISFFSGCALDSCGEGQFLAWGEWGPCSQSCGRDPGIRTRNRFCPSAGGCIGEDSSSELCVAGPCINAFDEWTPWRFQSVSLPVPTPRVG